MIGKEGGPIKKEMFQHDERLMVLGGRRHLHGVEVPDSGIFNHVIVAIDGTTKYAILEPSRGERAIAVSIILKGKPSRG